MVVQYQSINPHCAQKRRLIFFYQMQDNCRRVYRHKNAFPFGRGIAESLFLTKGKIYKQQFGNSLETMHLCTSPKRLINLKIVGQEDHLAPDVVQQGGKGFLPLKKRRNNRPFLPAPENYTHGLNFNIVYKLTKE